MAIKKKEESVEINVLEITVGEAEVGIIFSRPVIFNHFSEKAKRELLYPRGNKTAADRAGNLKHDPLQEYRDSIYRNPGDTCATRLCLPAAAFKGAMATAALDLPGTAKTAVNRLVWVEGHTVDIFGVPKIFMSVVRNSDLKHTPDIRTRAIVPVAACVIRVSFVRPKLSGRAVFNLLAAGGITCGIGDFRQEKGKGNFGQYRVCDPTDPELLEIMKTGGREAQDLALANPEFFDADSEDLYTWYKREFEKRGFDSVEFQKRPRRSKAAVDIAPASEH